MPDFHRLEAPPADYDLGADPGPLPATYDYINNDPAAAVGTAAGERAGSSTGPKPSGFNSGTYFLAWRDPALSANVNRIAKALAENDDYLDKLFRRRIAQVTKVSQTLAGASYFELTGYKVYTGTDPAAAANTLVQLLNPGATAEEEIFISSSMTYIRPTDIQPTGGGASVIGTGWVTSPRIVLNAAATGTYNCYFLQQSSLARMGAGALSFFQRRDAAGQEIQKILLQIVGNASVASTTYKSTPDTSLRHLAHSGLDERYRKATISATGAGAGTAGNLDTPGSGAIIDRDGIAPASVSSLAGVVKRKYVDPINAHWRAESFDAGGSLPSRSNSSLGSTGFVSYGNRWTIRGERNYTPSLATFMSLLPSLETAAPVSGGGYKKYSHIPSASSGSITRLGGTNDFYVLTLDGTGAYPDPYFWVDLGGGSHKTSVSIKRDFIELIFAGASPATRIYQIVALYDTGGGTDNRKAVICPIDTGVDNDIPGGTTAVTCRIVRSQWVVGQASPVSKVAFDGVALPSPVTSTDLSLEGMYLAAAPQETTDQAVSTDEFYNPTLTNPLLELVGELSTRKVLSAREFGYNPAASTASTEHGYLTARGTLSIRKVVPHVVGQDSISGGADPQSYTADFTDNQKVIVEATVARTISNLILKLGTLGLATGAEIELFVRHSSGGPGYLTGPTQWGVDIGGVTTYGLVYFENAADAFLKGATGWVDWYRFVNIGTNLSPILIGTVSRMGGGAL